MTPATLSAEIDAIREVLYELNEMRPLEVRQVAYKGEVMMYLYGPLEQSSEKEITRLAERIARLQRFRSMLLAKEYALDRHDWISPQDLQISVASVRAVL